MVRSVCRVDLSRLDFGVLQQSFVGNVVPAYGFFYATESNEDQEWERDQCLINLWNVVLPHIVILKLCCCKTSSTLKLLIRMDVCTLCVLN